MSQDLEKLVAAATPGPWRWEVSLASKAVKLCGGHPHRGFGKYDLTVMDFVRWGMSRAAPLFWKWNDKSLGDPMRADDLAVPVAGQIAFLCQTDLMRDPALQAQMVAVIADALNKRFGGEQPQ